MDAFELDLSLLSTDTSVAENLLYYIVRKEVPRDMLPTSEDRSNARTAARQAEIAIKCWCLGERLGMADFQNQIMFHILGFMPAYGGLISPTTMMLAFEKTPQRSKLRKILVEYIAMGTYSGDVDFDALSYFQDVEGFAQEFLAACISTRGRRGWLESRLEPAHVKEYMIEP